MLGDNNFYPTTSFRQDIREGDRLGRGRGRGAEFERGRRQYPDRRHDLSVANSYSRGDREFEKATAMLFPSKVAQRGRMPFAGIDSGPPTDV